MENHFKESVEHITNLLKEVLKDSCISVCLIDKCIYSAIFYVKIDKYEHTIMIYTEETDHVGLKRNALAVLVEYASFKMDQLTQGVIQ